MKKIIFKVTDQPIIEIPMNADATVDNDNVVIFDEILAKIAIPKLASTSELTYGDVSKIIKYYLLKWFDKDYYNKKSLSDIAKEYNYKIENIECKKNLIIEFVGYE
ncbi:hypothetical protein [Macrococcoides caseolyticum]|uniref:hypothetical protein n=1 Tax=Macrococcoides caseolyticum TaxID=69966 RepID=UPI000C3311CE|nr:hypothetical protein [Macrococcus caseolyticus]PKE62172.1 hypothetical protein CW683_11740 [Macrococcus caseolyticus]PKF44350.1 hypothetical protein CW664_11305 [Macrococcus caseolyticus]